MLEVHPTESLASAQTVTDNPCTVTIAAKHCHKSTLLMSAFVDSEIG